VSRLSGPPRGSPQGPCAACCVWSCASPLSGARAGALPRPPSPVKAPSSARSVQDRSLLKDSSAPRAALDDHRGYEAPPGPRRARCVSVEARPPSLHGVPASCRRPKPRFVSSRAAWRLCSQHLVGNPDLLSGLRLGDLAGKESGGRPSTLPSDSSKHQSPYKYTDLEQCHSWRVGLNTGLSSPVCSQRIWATKCSTRLPRIGTVPAYVCESFT